MKSIHLVCNAHLDPVWLWEWEEGAAAAASTFRAAADFCRVVLWGVGNHGGGPSRKDLRGLARLMASRTDARIRPSTPERFFPELSAERGNLPVLKRDLNPWAVGCYTSQVRIKQQHRLLENELFATEKMAAAWCLHAVPYPGGTRREAARPRRTASGLAGSRSRRSSSTSRAAYGRKPT
ncbi:MAG: hypothetical protein JXR37_28890 [Kiritimatiellae bacterium]|nr:hypothetical protein [Kiritimatiellia bacterium]